MSDNPTLMLNSSGGFSIPTAAFSSASSDKTPSLSPQPTTSYQRPSKNSVFFLGDDDLSSRSSRSASCSLDRPNSSSDDPLSPVFQTEHLSPSIKTPHRLPSNSSSSSSSLHQHSPAIVRTAPLYISVYSSTPPIPVVKGTVSSSAPPTNNNEDEPLFTRRSPSPQPPSILKKSEQSNNPIRQILTSSMQQSPNENLQQQQTTSFHRHHHHPTTSSSKEQQKR